MGNLKQLIIAIAVAAILGPALAAPPHASAVPQKRYPPIFANGTAFVRGASICVRYSDGKPELQVTVPPAGQSDRAPVLSLRGSLCAFVRIDDKTERPEIWIALADPKGRLQTRCLRSRFWSIPQESDIRLAFVTSSQISVTNATGKAMLINTKGERIDAQGRPIR